MPLIKSLKPEDMKPLFCAVNSLAYFWYMAGKDVELRNSRNWNLKTVVEGRPIILSKGYSGERWDGTIGHDIYQGTLAYILKNIDYKRIIPREDINEKEARNIIGKIMKSEPENTYLAFNLTKSSRKY